MQIFWIMLMIHTTAFTLLKHHTLNITPLIIYKTIILSVFFPLDNYFNFDIIFIKFYYIFILYDVLILIFIVIFVVLNCIIGILFYFELIPYKCF